MALYSKPRPSRTPSQIFFSCAMCEAWRVRQVLVEATLGSALHRISRLRMSTSRPSSAARSPQVSCGVVCKIRSTSRSAFSVALYCLWGHFLMPTFLRHPQRRLSRGKRGNREDACGTHRHIDLNAVRPHGIALAASMRDRCSSATNSAFATIVPLSALRKHPSRTFCDALCATFSQLASDKPVPRGCVGIVAAAALAVEHSGGGGWDGGGGGGGEGGGGGGDGGSSPGQDAVAGASRAASSRIWPAAVAP